MELGDVALGLPEEPVAEPLLRPDKRLDRRLAIAYCSSKVTMAGPLIISGVRASSIRIESTSSTMA